MYFHIAICGPRQIEGIKKVKGGSHKLSPYAFFRN
ncbi:MAG: hypothetical protein RL650_2688 [Pseudomonadota bacterium]|jgi:hypothetical protein